MDPLLALVRLKSLEEIITAAKETIHRHRRRYLQRNLRPCPTNCQKANMVGHKVVGCSGCGSPNSDKCLKEAKFVPILTKDELAKQFANQLRNPEALLREYRDVTVFLWVLGAFDKQKKTVDEHIVSKVEQREKPNGNTTAATASGSQSDGHHSRAGSHDPEAADGNVDPVPNVEAFPAARGGLQRRVISRSTSTIK